MKRHDRRRWVYAALCLLAALLFADRARHVRAEQSRPYGLYTARQIFARSTPLCRLLAPQAALLSLTAQSFAVHRRDGTPRRIWAVEAVDESDDYAASLGWDAETGDLLFAGRPSPASISSTRPALNRREAIITAQGWLGLLGIARAARGWRLSSAPKRTDTRWRVFWQAEDRQATVTIDARSGDLIHIKNIPRHGLQVLTQALH